MFKALFEFIDSGKPNAASEEAVANIDKFAFAEKLHEKIGTTSDPQQVIRGIISP